MRNQKNYKEIGKELGGCSLTGLSEKKEALGMKKMKQGRAEQGA